MGIAGTSSGLQVLGGYGYTDEFSAEQYFRDMRIHAIHEGTTGIQAMDLLGRKVMMHGGKAFATFVEEVEQTLTAAGAIDELSAYADRLRQALEVLRGVTAAKLELARGGRLAVFLADATLYLELFGLVVVAWQWLKQGLAACQGLAAAGAGSSEADFYQGKLATMRFFFHYELPKSQGLATRLNEDDGLTAVLGEGCFTD
jgi:butyryl-CoA dehydrogenase